MPTDTREVPSRQLAWCFVACLLLVSSTVFGTTSPDTSRTLPPSARLGVLLVVDQMRADYLTRFAPEFTGGLARLLKQGVHYTNAFHDHAATETAVGHATISTGRFPSHNGIVANDWYDRELKRVIYSCEDSSVHILGEPKAVGRSSKLMLTNAIGDWLKDVYPGAKVYTLALKDRAAIAMGGRRPDGAFWYSRTTGTYITSDYYMQAYPAWVDSFNAAKPADAFLHHAWSKLRPDSSYSLSHEDNFPSENDGKNTVFPHLFDTAAKAPDRHFYDAFYGTPFADEMTLSFARSIVRHTDIGKDTIPDLLCISCSAADAIGHAYGPNSQEVQDYYLRLDRYLDTFFVFLDSAVGAGNYCVALSGDHGVLPLPEDLVRQGLPAVRQSVDTVIKDIFEIGEQLQKEMKFAANPIADAGYDVQLTYDDARMKGISDADFQQMVATRIRKLPYIADAFTRDELQSGSAEGRPYYEQFHNSFEPLRGPDIYLRFQEYMLVGKSKFGTSHGTPYAYDTNVPIVFLSRISSAGTSDERVKTVDIAPTLARLLGVVPPKELDGQPLERALGTKP
jgi:predicted AlkP superfamily pyrophosphatase or phosphodiesterase